MDTAEYVIRGLTAALLAYFWYDKKKTDNEIDEQKKTIARVSTKQAEHDTKFVTDQRVRDIVKDEIKPIKEDLSGMKVNVESIMRSLQDLTVSIRVHNALRDREEKSK